MKSTREKILHTLLNQPGSTVNDLAQAAGINSISVRHHLSSLQAEGLVIEDEEKHGVGRPRSVFSLSEKGIETFPTRYLRLTNRLLDQLKGTLSEAMISQLFAQIAGNLASEYAQKVIAYPIEKKLEIIKLLLSEEGFRIEFEKNGSEYLIHQHSCPYYRVGQNHPEVCEIDQVLLSTILSMPVRKIACILNGDGQCTYITNDTE